MNGTQSSMVLIFLAYNLIFLSCQKGNMADEISGLTAKIFEGNFEF